ncbi:MAG: hypothetical protein JNK58_01675 [Phycisphaerae bacterium]|nr:hypothetical protein [Phycisphaerae bacterium]
MVIFAVSSTALASLQEYVQALGASDSITSPAFTDRTGYVDVVMDVAGTLSMDALGSANNQIAYFWIGAGNSLNGIGWDVTLQTIHPASRRSDIRVHITNSAGVLGTGFLLAPGILDQSPGGPTNYSSDGQILKLADYNIPSIFALEDGLIRLEFVDLIDESPGSADGLWVNGLLFMQTGAAVPAAPGSFGLIVFACVASLRRAREQT